MNINRGSLLGLVPVVAILAAFWFLVLAPTRAEVSSTQTQVLQATTRRDGDVATAAAAERARLHYPRSYASVARLARAVPVDEDVAALVRGLDSLARANKLDFRTIALSEAVPTKAPATPSAATGGAGGAPSTPGTGAATTPAAGATAPSAAGTTAPAAAGTTTAPAAAGTTTAPAAAGATAGTSGAAAAQAPPGEAVGAAGLLTMPFTFTAEGGYLALQRFLEALHAGAGHHGGRITFDGRLLTIDGFSYVAGRKGFPQLAALVSATAYIEPDPGGVIARSTARVPASAPAAPAPAGGVLPSTPAPAQGAAG
jgi:hypothetical protein